MFVRLEKGSFVTFRIFVSALVIIQYMRFVGLLQHLQLFVHYISSILEPFMDSKRIRRCCLNDPDVLCYICGEYMAKEHRFDVRDVTKKAYQAYLGMKLGDQDKS